MISTISTKFDIMLHMAFNDWLESELYKRHWNHSELARQINMTEPAISHVFSGKRRAGKDMCLAIAEAFKIPPDVVFREAGLLPPENNTDEIIEEILYNLGGFCMTDKEEIREYILMKRKIAEKNGTYVLNVRDIPC